MKHILWLLKWLLKAAIFFTLFAFALNNQQDTTVHFFFGHFWRGPQVLMVLAAFSAGVVVGVLGMLPRWLSQRLARPAQAVENKPPLVPPQNSAIPGYPDGI